MFQLPSLPISHGPFWTLSSKDGQDGGRSERSALTDGFSHTPGFSRGREQGLAQMESGCVAKMCKESQLHQRRAQTLAKPSALCHVRYHVLCHCPSVLAHRTSVDSNLCGRMMVIHGVRFEKRCVLNVSEHKEIQKWAGP